MIRAGVSKMTIPSLTVDELLTTINRTSLPTIIVEGSDDVAIYRWIEKQILRKNADVIQCGGRKKLIAVYERRHEIKKNISIVFWLIKICGYTKAYQQNTKVLFLPEVIV